MADNGRIGILCAMAVELEDLAHNLEDSEIVSECGYDFHVGRFGDTDVVLVQCGIGLVNAARGTQLMIDKFKPSVIINSGIAGGTKSGLSVGDIVISTSLVQHDFNATPFGYVRGYQCTGTDDDGSEPTMYYADEELVGKIKSISLELPETSKEGRTVHTGIIASGDMFVASSKTKSKIHDAFGATAAEMEGSAIAQVASYAGIPFVVLRVISDLADGTAPGNYKEFEKKAAYFSAYLIRKCIEKL